MTTQTKIVFIGDDKVGKTSLLLRMLRDLYNEEYTPTAAAKFSQFVLNYNGYTLPCMLWDTAGKEDFLSILPLYIKNSKIIVLVYSVDSNDDFDFYYETWMKILNGCDISGYKLLVVCNKTDKSNWTTPKIEIIDFLESKSLKPIFVSAYDGTNICEFKDLLSSIVYQIDGKRR